MDLSIIIVNWKSKDYLQKCIASILAETYQIAFEIIVIDSASYDGCEEMLHEHYPQVRFIQSEKNLGFARANNVAYAVSTGENVLFLNPDTELRGAAINLMLEQLQTLPNAGILGARLLNSDGTVQTSCIQSLPTILNQMLDSEALRARWPRSGLWGMAPLFDKISEPNEVEAVCGASMMLKRSVFDRVGHFSEDYFMYGEDIDLSYKVRCLGCKNFYVPTAVIVHHGGTSTQQTVSNFSSVMVRQSVWLFLRKTRGRFYGFGYRFGILVSAFFRLVLLAALLPWQHLRQRRKVWDQSFCKWRAILRWSIHPRQWLNQHQ